MIALGTVLWASTQVVDGLELTLLRQAEQQRLAERVQSIRTVVERQYPAPVTADRLLERLESIRSNAAPAPITVFSVLHEVLADHPAVDLNSLTWRWADVEADEPVQMTSTDAASVRPSTHPTLYVGLRVEIAGRLDRDLSLRERQARLHAFSDALGADTEVRDVRLISTPVTREAEGSAADGATTDVDFRLQYEMTHG